ncbi:MAG: hypothetical protein KBA61_12480 [Spirochaetes bacterium]|nr:hypothetical protein [Spirochaetota bacterium]
MRKSFFPFLAVLLLMPFITMCDLVNDNDDPQSEGSVEITSVSPSAGLTNGASYTFTVQVSYSLQSESQGELTIGFNNDDSDINVCWLIDGVDYIVDSGSGSHTFTVTNVVAKNWGTAGDFEVSVYLSEYPHGDTWEPLDSDSQVLTF